MAALAACVSPAYFGRRTTTKTRPLLYLVPFFFGAALGTCYQLAHQAVSSSARSLLKAPTNEKGHALSYFKSTSAQRNANRSARTPTIALSSSL
jgi:hypothetical protein